MNRDDLNVRSAFLTVAEERGLRAPLLAGGA